VDIEYELNIDDLVAYNMYYYTRSPQIKRRMKIRKVIYFGTALIILFFAIYITITRSLSWPIISIAFGYVLFILLVAIYNFNKSMIQKRIRKELTRRYGQDRNDVIGKHEFSITQEEIKDSTEMGEQMTRWDVIEDVVETDKYLFILLHGLAEAYIIPKRAFADEAGFTQFKDETIKYHQVIKEA
jgi:hypothetical protein